MLNLATIEETASAPTVRIELNGEVVFATAETWTEAADRLVTKHDGGVPKVSQVAAVAIAAPLPAPKTLDIADSTAIVEATGEVRSTDDLEAARAAGFAPRATIYRRGTRVNAIGVANATKSRAQYDAMPTVGPAMRDLATAIRNEERHDVTVDTYAIRMATTGEVKFNGRTAALTRPALSSLASYHIGMGGGEYLAKCWPELRAMNVNAWLDAKQEEELTAKSLLSDKALRSWKPARTKLRLRRSGDGQEIFGAVSSSYTSFDIDQVARAVELGMPADARATVSYDGHKAIIDVTFHSNVQPKHYVCGEFFKCGIRIETADNGGSSLTGSAFVHQNLCLNLIVIDRQSAPLFRIRHMGSVHKLAAKFRQGIRDGLKKLEHFLKAWDYSVETPVLSDVVSDPGVEVPLSIEEALPGIFNGILERELVPVRGPRKEAVAGLMRMWSEDDSAAAGNTRGAIVNAFTRYAHRVESDEFAGAEIEGAVSALLYGKGDNRPAPLPYYPMTSR